MVHSSREEPGTEPGFLLSFSIFCNTASLSAVPRPAAAASPWNWWKCMSWSHLLNQELRNQTAISICDLRTSPGGDTCWTTWLRWSRNYLRCRRPGFDPWGGKTPWRRKGQPTPVFWPGKSHRQRGLAGYNPWGHKQSDTTEWLMLSLSHDRQGLWCSSGTTALPLVPKHDHHS